jgi:hypothetical protein
MAGRGDRLLKKFAEALALAESRMTDFFMPCQGENQWMVMSN